MPDPSEAYIETVRKAILEHNPEEYVDKEALEKTAFYLHYNNYTLDEVDCGLVYYTYDVLKWTEAEL